MNGITVTSTPGTIPIVTAPTKPISVTVPVGKTGPAGPPGQDALWESMTQAEYDALEVAGTLDPNTLYVIIE